MAVAAYDTQQGATLTLSTDSLTLRLTDIGALRKVIEMIRLTNLATTADHEWIPGELANYPPVPITWQNSPGLANPSNAVQTVTITGPLATGAAVAESVTGTGFVVECDVIPGFSSGSEGLQMKSGTLKYDGITGPTRTVSS